MALYTCEKCSKNFDRGCGLASHLRSHEKLICPGCRFDAPDKAALEQHRRTCAHETAPSTPGTSQKTPKQERQAPIPRTPGSDEHEAGSSNSIRKKEEVPSLRRQAHESSQGVNENSAPSSRKVSFLVSKSESKLKNGPIQNGSTPEAVTSQPSETGNMEEEPPVAAKVDYRRFYSQLPPGKFATLVAGTGFPRRERTTSLPTLPLTVFDANPENSSMRPESSEGSSEERPPKLEDFFAMPGLFGQERHPVEANQLYLGALEEYNNKMKAQPLKCRPGSPQILPAREYVAKKLEAEKSGECPDCPYKNLDLAEFRAHRARHELGARYKCSECSYASHNKKITAKHTHDMHFLRDVKVLEGIPPSDSEDDGKGNQRHGNRAGQGVQKKKPRRRNW